MIKILDRMSRPSSGSGRESGALAFRASDFVDDKSMVEYYRNRIRERYNAEFSALAERLCGDPTLAGQALENAYTQAFESWSECGDPANFRPWFTEILTGQCGAIQRAS